MKPTEKEWKFSLLKELNGGIFSLHSLLHNVNYDHLCSSDVSSEFLSDDVSNFNNLYTYMATNEYATFNDLLSNDEVGNSESCSSNIACKISSCSNYVVLNSDLCSSNDVDTYRVNHVDCNCNVCLQTKCVQIRKWQST